MDKRQQRTRQAIFDAFSTLLQRKKLCTITVQEIIDEAKIGRSTFYAHFETKDDLLGALCDELFTHVFDAQATKSSEGGFSDARDFKQYLTHMLLHLHERRELLQKLLACEDGAIFMDSFKAHLYRVFRTYQSRAAQAVPAEYILDMTVCTFAETVRWWMVDAPTYTHTDIAHFFTAYATLPCECPAQATSHCIRAVV